MPLRPTTDDGAPSVAPVPAPTVSRAPTPPRRPTEPPDPRQRLAIGLGIVLMVMVLAIGAAALFGGPRATPSPSPFTGGLFDPSPSPPTSPSASPTTSPSQPAPTVPPTPTPVPATPTPVLVTPSLTATPTITPTASPTGSLSPSPSATPTPTIAPATSTPPAPTPSPTEDSGNVSGTIDPATGSFLESTLLDETDLEPYGGSRDGPIEAGNILNDYASFATNNGRGVVWQGWRGSGMVRRITDVRLAFPTTEDAIGFVAGFGDEVSRNEGLTEFEPIAIGEETRAFAARVTNPAGDEASHVRYIFRRGDLIGISASVVVTDDEQAASDTAAAIASRAGRKLDDAVGIQP